MKALLPLLPVLALAHPMGEQSINRSALLAVRPSEIQLLYVVEFAEVPSAAEQERVGALGREAYARTRMEELLPGLTLTLDGTPLSLSIDGCKQSTGVGEGGLPAVTLLCDLGAPAVDAGRLRFEDHNFDGAVGWRELRLVGDGVPVGGGSPAEAVGEGQVPLPFSTPPERMILSSVEATVGVLDGPGWSQVEGPEARSTAGVLASAPWRAVALVVILVGLGVAFAASRRRRRWRTDAR